MRSTNNAPDFLSNSYFTGSPPTGTSMTTLTLFGGSSPMGMRSRFIASFLGQVSGAPKDRQAEEQRRKARGDRSQDIARRHPECMALNEQSRIEREGRKGGESAEYACREEQFHVLADTGPKGEIAGEQPHQERAGNVHDQGSERKAVAEQ